MLTRSQLLKLHRPEKSGLTLFNQRLTVSKLSDCSEVLAVEVDIKTASDSLHREALWDLLRLRGTPAGVIGLLTRLYSGTWVYCDVGDEGQVSSLFPVNLGVRQGVFVLHHCQYYLVKL